MTIDKKILDVNKKILEAVNTPVFIVFDTLAEAWFDKNVLADFRNLKTKEVVNKNDVIDAMILRLEKYKEVE